MLYKNLLTGLIASGAQQVVNADYHKATIAPNGVGPTGTVTIEHQGNTQTCFDQELEWNLDNLDGAYPCDAYGDKCRFSVQTGTCADAFSLGTEEIKNSALTSGNDVCEGSMEEEPIDADGSVSDPGVSVSDPAILHNDFSRGCSSGTGNSPVTKLTGGTGNARSLRGGYSKKSQHSYRATAAAMSKKQAMVQKLSEGVQIQKSIQKNKKEKLELDLRIDGEMNEQSALTEDAADDVAANGAMKRSLYGGPAPVSSSSLTAPSSWSQKPWQTRRKVKRMHRKLRRRMLRVYRKGKKANSGKLIPLDNSHFKYGTVAVYKDRYICTQGNTAVQTMTDTTGMVFRLTEDIIFNPQALADNSVATKEDVWNLMRMTHESFDLYEPGAYGVGFFAAIMLSCEDCVLDLNGFTLKQGDDHYLFQRFYANIEIGSSPFIAGQGPSGFCDANVPNCFKSAKNVYIRNGKIGRSSHHGIHGNTAEGVFLQKITFSNYEVAAVHLNEVKKLSAVRLDMLGSTTEAPVLGTFSAAGFIRPFLDKAVTLLTAAGTQMTFNRGSGTKETITAENVRDNLKTCIFNAWSDIVKDKASTNPNGQIGFINKSTHPKEWSLFNNMNRIVDGNPYGFAINKRGAAVLGFPDSPADGIAPNAEEIFLRRINIKNHVGLIREIPTMMHGPELFGSSQNDPIGAVFQVMNVDGDGDLITINDAGEYTGNCVTDAQLTVSTAINNGLDFDHLIVSRNSISVVSQKWAAGDVGHETLHSSVGANDWRIGSFSLNGDTMFHVNKGVIGFKLDAAIDVFGVELHVDGLLAAGLQGQMHNTFPVPMYTDVPNHRINSRDRSYMNRMQTSRLAATQPGYNGAAARGFSMASSKNVFLTKTSVKNSVSRHGVFYAYDVHRRSENVLIKKSFAESTFGGTMGCFGANINQDLQNCQSCGIRRGPLTRATTKIVKFGYDQRIWNQAKYSVSDEGESKNWCPEMDDYTEDAEDDVDDDEAIDYVDPEAPETKKLQLVTGLQSANFDGKALVVLNYVGKVVGCGELVKTTGAYVPVHRMLEEEAKKSEGSL